MKKKTVGSKKEQLEKNRNSLYEEKITSAKPGLSQLAKQFRGQVRKLKGGKNGKMGRSGKSTGNEANTVNKPQKRKNLERFCGKIIQDCEFFERSHG